MSDAMKQGPSLEQLLQDFKNPKYRISAREFYIVALPTADDEDPDSFIDRIPERLRAGFERIVFDYCLPEEGERVSYNVRNPKDETVRALRRAFLRRRSE